MENLTISNMTALGKETMAALLDETSIAVNSPSVHATTSGIAMVIACVVGVSLVLLATLYIGLGLFGFVAIGILPLSFAAAWMSSLGIVAAGSIFALLQSIAMGGVPVLFVWLTLLALVAAAVGVYEAIVWLLHLWPSLSAWLPQSWHSVSGWVLDIWPSCAAWLLQSWHSVSGWVLDIWPSCAAWLLQSWHSVVAWIHGLWNSIPVHHKWKILYT